MKAKKQKSFILTLAGIALVVGIKTIISESNRYDLRGKTVIITGGSRGLGLVLARHLAACGAKIVICSRTQEQLDNASRELKALGADVLALQCDITDKSQVSRMIESSIDHFGQVDVLINNAGVIQVGPQEVMTEKDYETAMDTHFWGPLYTTLAILPYFRSQKHGRIVNIASIGGKIPVPHLLPYSASKFALVGLSEGLGVELRKENILVTTVVPSLMRTGSPRNISVKGNHEKEYAWFKTAASLSLVSKEPTDVARSIVAGLESNNTRPLISGAERVASITKELFPEAFEFVLSQVDRILPNNAITGMNTKKGYQSESGLSSNKIARGADADAYLNNEN